MSIKFLRQKKLIITFLIVVVAAISSYFIFLSRTDTQEKTEATTFLQILEDKCASKDREIECESNILHTDKLEYYSIDLQDGRAYIYTEGELNVAQVAIFEITGYIDTEVDIYRSISDEDNDVEVYVGFNQKWGVNYFGTPVNDLPLYLIAIRKIELPSGETVIVSYKQNLLSPGGKRVSEIVNQYATRATEENWEDFYMCLDTEDGVFDEECEETKQSYIGELVLHVDDSKEAQRALAKAINKNADFFTAAEKEKIQETVRDILEIEL